MASQNEIESAYNATKGKLDTIVSKMTALLAKIDAVNPDEPGALSKINAIADERTAARTEFNDGGGSAAFQNFRNLYDSSPEYQASFKSEYDSIWESFNSGKADSERLKARIELKKMSAESAEAKAKNNAPSANAAPVTPPAAPVPGNEPKNNLVGSADGDSNKDVNASQAALQQSSAAQQEIDKPTRRLYNPLAKFPSSTYNISLYMITPRAYDAFVASGRQKLNLGNGDVVTIAQSGGINSATQTRAAGFTLDYYIDNLRITTLTSAADTNAATNTSELDFNILEPYGFSFISNLKSAADDLIAKAKTDDPEYEQLDNSLRQFFILGIRFTGWNGDGTPASSKEDPLFERFYDIFLKSMTFKLDNKATVYSISAASMSPGVVFGTKRGVWDTGGTLRGRTVYDMLRNMMDQMNKQSADLVKGTKIKPNKYDFKFVGEGVGDTPAAQKASPIFKSLMVSPSDVTKASLVGSVPAKTDGNVPKDQGQPDTTVGEIKIASGTPILQAFLNIIQLSTFTTDAFKVIQTNALENNDKKANGQTQQKTDSQATVQWFNVSAECTGATYSKQLADFTWNIMYVFTIYETPVITNPYSNLGIDYYGPHKRYKYWFTGQNSEILSYSQTLDNTFFNVSLLPTSSNEETDSSNDISQTPGKKDNIENTGTQNVQDAAKKAYVTSLFDPGAYANASIKIMGDPDFLMPDTQTSINSLYDKFYGTQGSFTVNPNSGQVFIEIDFKEPQDYGFKSSDNITYTATDDGLMGMNDKIKFWDYPKEIADIVEGVSYRVLSVKSVFNQGKFEQDIQCTINTFNGYESKGDQAQREASLEEVQVTGRRASAAGGQGQAPAGTSGGSNPSTLVADKPVTASAGGKGPGTTTNSTSGNSGQTSSNDDQNPPRGNLIINPPNLIEAGNINITAPNINLGRGGG